MLALAIFTMSGLAILGVINQTLAGLSAARDAQRAADLAVSAMAEIEAGISTPEALNGPVPVWDPAVELDGATPDGPPEPLLWELQIETEGSSFAGLTAVTIHARKLAAPDSDQVVASYTLRQLVRLSARADDVVGEEDELAAAAREALGTGRGARGGGGR